MRISRSIQETEVESTTPERWQRPALVIAAIVAVGLVARFFWQIHGWATDIIFWDQWVFYIGAWDGHSEWALFNWQHGPHRMGIGLNLMRLINEAFAWDQRILAFFVGGCMLLAAFGALWLKRRVAGRLEWHDIAIPLLLLSGVQWELYASCINLSHGALPLLLVVCIALALNLPGRVLKYLLIGALTFLATFTGFGFFCVVAVPAILAVRAVGVIADRRRPGTRWSELGGIALGVACCAATAVAFFWTYEWQPAVPGFVFPHPRPWEYLEFMAASSAYLFGARHPGINKPPGEGEIIFGCVVLAAFAAAGLWAIQRIWRQRDDSTAYIALFLLLFSGAFLINMAVGRVSTGLENAMASRYTPLIMPAGLALYLVALQLRRRSWRVVAIWLLLIATAIGSFRSPGSLRSHYVKGKARWLAAYRQTGDYMESERRSGFQIFPAPDAFGLDIPGRVRWLEERKLSFGRQAPERQSTITPPSSADEPARSPVTTPPKL